MTVLKHIWETTAGKTLVLLLVTFPLGVGGVVMAVGNQKPPSVSPPQPALTVPLAISAPEAAKNSALVVNGNLRIGGTTSLKPSQRPLKPSFGEQYVDSNDRQLYYYDGTRWVVLGRDEAVLGLIGGRVRLQPEADQAVQTGTVRLTGTLQAALLQGSGAGLTALNASNVTSGTISNDRLDANVTRLGQTIEGAEITLRTVTAANVADGTLANQQIAADAGIVDSKLATISSAGKVADSAISPNVALLSRSDQTFAGRQIFRNLVNSGTALTIQNAAAGALFTVDTAASRVRIGDGTTATVFQVDQILTTNLPPANPSLNGGVVYDSFSQKFKIIENGVYKELCNKLDQGCGAAGAVTLQGAYDGGNTITTSTGRDLAFNLQNAGNLLANLSAGSRFAVRSGALDTLAVSASGQLTFRNALDSTTAFRVQNAASSDLITVDSTGTGSVTINGLRGVGTALTALDASQVTLGILSNARLSATVSLLGQTIDSTEIVDGTLTDADISSAAAISDTKLGTIQSAGKVADSALSANVALLDRNDQIFAGRSVFRAGANSPVAFQIQSSASTDTLFKADTSANVVRIGDGDNSGAARTTLLVVDASSTTNLPLGVNGGIIYDSTTNKFKVYENGTYKVLCNETDRACGDTGSGTIASLQTAYDNGNTIVTAGTRDVSIKSSTTANFLLQRSNDDMLFRTDDTANRLIVGNATALGLNDTTLFVVDSSSTANRPSGANGGLLYDSSLNKLVVYENGLYKEVCNKTDLGCAAPPPTVTLQSAYDNGNLIQTATGRNLQVTLAAGSNFSLQRADADTLLTTDTDANIVRIGNGAAAGFTNSTLLVVDSATTANLPGGVNGGIVYNSTSQKFTIYENGAYKELCNKTDLGCGTTAAITTSLQDAYNNSGSPATIVTSSTLKNVVIQAGAGQDNAGLFQVQNATGEKVFSVDSSLASVSINGAGTGQPGGWETGSALSATRARHAAVSTGGYIFVVGGTLDGTTATNSVIAAPVSGNGVLGAWTAGPSLPASVEQHQAIVVGEYLYVIGGRASATGVALDTVYYARLGKNGTLGAWQTAAPLPTPNANFSVTTAGGAIYITGGSESRTDVLRSSVRADGSLEGWQTLTPLPAGSGRMWHASHMANGYLYVVGGENSGLVFSTVFYAKVNGDGTIGAWTTAAQPLPSPGRRKAASVLANGHLYVTAGDVNGTANSVIFSRLNNDGSLGAWKTAANALPAVNQEHAAVYASGNIYVLGGIENGGLRAAVFYATLPRLQLSGTLDLLGLTTGDVDGGGAGGNLIAGNALISGTLDVTQQATIGGRLSVKDSLNVSGGALIRSSTDSAVAFQVQSASGTTFLGVNTATGKLYSTVADSGVAVGFTFDTPAFTAAGAKLISLQSGGVEKFAIDKDGKILTASVQTSSIVDGAVTPAKLSAQPAARVYNATNQTLTTGILTTLLFGSERFDSDGIHDTVTNSGRLTAVTSGLYAITGQANFATNATGSRSLGIRLNGTTELAQDERPSSGATPTSTTLTTYYRLNAGDYVELLAQQNSGGNLDVTATGDSSPAFSLVWQSP